MDQIATLQIEEMDRHHPDSPSLRLLAGLPPRPTESSNGCSTLATDITGFGLDITSPNQGSTVSDGTGISAKVLEPKPIDLQRKISTGHREFEEKALAVSIDQSLGSRWGTDLSGLKTSQRRF